jgi:hypothetical protein
VIEEMLAAVTVTYVALALVGMVIALNVGGLAAQLASHTARLLPRSDSANQAWASQSRAWRWWGAGCFFAAVEMPLIAFGRGLAAEAIYRLLIGLDFGAFMLVVIGSGLGNLVRDWRAGRPLATPVSNTAGFMVLFALLLVGGVYANGVLLNWRR